MSYTRKVIQQRPNTSVEFFSPTYEVVAKMNEYQSSGKILNYSLSNISADTLVKTIIITFKDVASFDDFMNQTIFVNSAKARETYCLNNSISFSLEEE
jgi:aryl-alcohol dehydrogenase-like predicted oxidoreductase